MWESARSSIRKARVGDRAAAETDAAGRAVVLEHLTAGWNNLNKCVAEVVVEVMMCCRKEVAAHPL
jgi:hypothetical protein